MRRIPSGIGWIPVPTAGYRPRGNTLSPPQLATLGAFLRLWAAGEDDLTVQLARLVIATGYSRRAVQNAIEALEEMGLIEVVSRGGGRSRPSTYRLLLPELQTVQEVHGNEASNGARAAQYEALKGAQKGARRAYAKKREILESESRADAQLAEVEMSEGADGFPRWTPRGTTTTTTTPTTPSPAAKTEAGEGSLVRCPE